MMGKCVFGGQTLEMNESHLFSIGYAQRRTEGGPLAEQEANRGAYDA
jgi:hypothetical protein